MPIFGHVHLLTSLTGSGDWGFVDHPGGWYGAPNEGQQRVSAAEAPDYVTGEGFAALPITGNLGYADRWIYLLGGQFGDGTAALWNQAAGTIDHGNTADPLSGDGFGPDVMMYAASKAGGGVYQTWSNGAPHLWNGEASAPAPAGTRPDWRYILNTDDPVSYFDGTNTIFGWGTTTLGVLPDPPNMKNNWGGAIAFQPFFGPFKTWSSADYGGDATLAAAARDADHSHPPGFGRVATFDHAAILNLNSHWASIASGWIIDQGEKPIGVPTAGSADFFIPALAVLLSSSSNPLSPTGWNQCLRVFAPYDIDNSFTGIGPGLPPPADNPFIWVEKIQIGGQDYAFFSASPYFEHNHDFLHPVDTAVLYMTIDHDSGAATIHASYLYSDDHTSIVGPVANGNDLYLCELNTGAQKLKLLKMTSPPDGWDVLASYDYTGAGLGGIGIVNGYLHVALGWLFTRSSSAHISPAPTNGQDILSYKLDDGPFVLMGRTFFPDGYSTPAVTPAKFFPATVSGTSGGSGGGGGGGGGTGPCDSTFFALGFTTMSAATLDGQLSGAGSPLLGEHDGAGWIALISGYGVNAAFWAAQARKEQFYGTDHSIIPLSSKNPMSLRYAHRALQSGSFNGFATYASYENAVRDYCVLMTNPPYAGLSISAILNLYAPPSENDTATYISQVCGWMNDWYLEMTP